MINSNKFGIVISFFSLWINTKFSADYQQIVGFVVIFLFGILHGSNDIALYNKIDNADSSISLNKVLLYYTSVVLLGVLLFYSIPIVALLLFIIFSGFHFGEQHWEHLKEKGSENAILLFQTLYGLFIFSLLFYFHAPEVKITVSQIIHTSIDFISFGWTTIIIGLALLISTIYINHRLENFKKYIIVNIFYLIVFAIVFKTADLIWAFAIYFVVWHSIPSIKTQINFLYGDFNFKNFGIYFKSAFPYWIISLIGIAGLYFLFKDKELFNALFFSFLAAITFPHTIIILKMQNRK